MVSTRKNQRSSKATSQSAPKASQSSAAQEMSTDVVLPRTTPVLSPSEKQEILSLSPRREQIMALVNRYPGLNSTQLGELINVSMTTASGVLCELFDKQYVHRRRTVAQPGKKVAPYVYFYGRDAGLVYSAQPIADQHSDASSSGRRHAPPPPVAADPSLFEAEERALLEESGMVSPETAEQNESNTDGAQTGTETNVTNASFGHDVEQAHAQEPEESHAAEEIVQVNFEPSATKSIPVSNTPPNRLGSMPVQARTAPARTAPSISAVPAQGAIVASLSGAIDELSDRLSDVVDGMAEHFSERLSSALSELVVQAISSKLNAKLHAKTVARLEDAIDDMLPREVAAIEDDAAERMKLANVVIVGLLPEQENMIREEFKDCFRLRFWKDGNPKSLREISGNADYILTFVDKIGHKHEDAILASGRKPDRVTGGMSSLRKRLTEIYVNH